MKLLKGSRTAEVAPVAIVKSEGLLTLIQQVVATIPGFPMAVRAEQKPLVAAEYSDLSRVNVLLLEADLNDPEAGARLEKLAARTESQCTLVIIAHNVDSRTTRRLFRAGAGDVLSFPVSSDELTTSLISALAPREGQKSQDHTGQIISVQKCGGGVGATMLVVNLGQLLSGIDSHPEGAFARVLLLDLDPQFGNMASVTHCEPRSSILQLIEAGDRLDATLFQAAVHPLGANLDILAAPEAILPFSALSPEFIKRLLDVAIASYDYVVIDHPQNWGGQTHPVFSRSEVIMLVMEANVEHANRAQAILSGLVELQLDTSNTMVVINKTLGLLHSDRTRRIEKVLQRPLETIPNREKLHRSAREQSRFVSTIPGAQSQTKALIKILRTAAEIKSALHGVNAVNSGSTEDKSVSEAM